MLRLMKLVLAVIQDADAAALMRALSDQQFEATKLASTGGFLREGNTTLMIGVDDGRLAALQALIGQTCRSRTRLVPARGLTSENEGGVAQEPVEVPVGGAVIFVLGVEDFVKV
ncbi:hypothetical protein GCM10010914_19730 [Deinococcus wulumuqiensis]|uniref:Transcriptional regulator n=2 Tax=Deinococcus wulumuqiensis TaxID=980427 RepID=A0AAV4K756_9DEIO|nr:hypothetical protein GCM10010914_19730 [Deinococcus wulumuqiensis]GGP30060.1 hypothetical protein GCM10008021_17110 [Deinococcus wulumuqiensis]